MYLLSDIGSKKFFGDLLNSLDVPDFVLYALSLFIGAFGVIALLWFLRGKTLLPVKLGKGQELTVVLRVRGSAPELENTVNAIEWLRADGTLPMNILIVDDGMDNETRRTAQLLARRKLIDFE